VTLGDADTRIAVFEMGRRGNRVEVKALEVTEATKPWLLPRASRTVKLSDPGSDTDAAWDDVARSVNVLVTDVTLIGDTNVSI